MGVRNCVNCGAPLEGRKCAYCGTVYNDYGVTAAFNKDDYTGTLTIGGNEYKVYLGKMEAFYTDESVGRDLNGQFHRVKGRMVHKFMLIER